MFIFFRAVLHRVPCSENGSEVPVARAFQLKDGVFVEPTLPEPFRVKAPGVREVVHAQGERPRDIRKSLRLIGFSPAPHVAHPKMFLFSDGVVCACEEADGGVSGGIAEQAARDANLFAGTRVTRDDAFDLGRARFFHGVNRVVEEQGDFRFGADNLLLGVVAELFLGSRRGFCVIGELVDDSSQLGVEAASGPAFCPDAHFAGAVSTEDGSVLNERDGAAHACCGNRRCGPAVTAANHDQVERTRVTGGTGEAADGAPPRA